jgi:hypothetical protein
LGKRGSVFESSHNQKVLVRVFTVRALRQLAHNPAISVSVIGSSLGGARSDGNRTPWGVAAPVLARPAPVGNGLDLRDRAVRVHP